jgi:hypothetical protein
MPMVTLIDMMEKGNVLLTAGCCLLGSGIDRSNKKEVQHLGVWVMR